jgi:hypothetical protein
MSPVDRPKRRVANERGIALLSVLGILAMLMVVSALVANSSRFEAALSGTARQSARAFAAADAGLGYALGDADNFIDPSKICQVPRCADAVHGRSTDLASTGVPVTGNVCVCFDHESPPPVEIRVSALRFKAFNFDVSSTGTASSNAQSKLNLAAVRLGPDQ